MINLILLNLKKIKISQGFFLTLSHLFNKWCNVFHLAFVCVGLSSGHCYKVTIVKKEKSVLGSFSAPAVGSLLFQCKPHPCHQVQYVRVHFTQGSLSLAASTAAAATHCALNSTWTYLFYGQNHPRKKERDLVNYILQGLCLMSIWINIQFSICRCINLILFLIQIMYKKNIYHLKHFICFLWFHFFGLSLKRHFQQALLTWFFYHALTAWSAGLQRGHFTGCVIFGQFITSTIVQQSLPKRTFSQVPYMLSFVY